MDSHALSDFTVLLVREDVKGLQVAVGRGTSSEHTPRRRLFFS